MGIDRLVCQRVTTTLLLPAYRTSLTAGAQPHKSWQHLVQLYVCLSAAEPRPRKILKSLSL